MFRRRLAWPVWLDWLACLAAASVLFYLLVLAALLLARAIFEFFQGIAI